MNILDLWDKGAHFLAFFVGAIPLVCALHWSFRWSWRKIVILSASALVLYGAADEYHQTFTANRSGADVLDWAADAVGGVVGAMVVAAGLARVPARRREDPPAAQIEIATAGSSGQ